MLNSKPNDCRRTLIAKLIPNEHELLAAVKTTGSRVPARLNSSLSLLECGFGFAEDDHTPAVLIKQQERDYVGLLNKKAFE